MAKRNRSHTNGTDMMVYQQGDVLLLAASLPVGARKNAGRVLAHGEVTGHAHAIHDADVDLFAPGEASILAERYLRIGAGGATVVHEDHAPIALPEGLYEVRHQREYEPDEIRRVAD